MGRDEENWKLIGTSHLFLNGAYNMIHMPNDVTPIIDKQGKNKGLQIIFTLYNIHFRNIKIFNPPYCLQSDWKRRKCIVI